MTTITAPTIDEIILSIVSGNHDDDLDAIYRAAKERRDLRAQATFYTVKVGTRATLMNLSPKYMVGAPCTVVTKNQTRIVVKIDQEWLEQHPQARRYVGKVTVRPDMLNVVADA